MGSQQTAAVVLISSATGVIGLGLGYMIAQKRLTAEFEERLERETNSIRRLYGAVKKIEEASLEDAPEVPEEEIPDGVKESLLDYQGDKREPVAYDKIRTTTAVKEKVEVTETLVNKNVFVERDERGEIYVVSEDEHGEQDYIEVTLTYYAGDGVVTDANEDRVEDYDTVIGDDFVNKFGEDQVVYVRNDSLCIDYEIVRSAGSYRKEVLGEEDEEAPALPSGRPRPSDRINSSG